MRAILSHLDNSDQVIEFGEYTRIRFDFGDESMRYIEVGIGRSSNGEPCLDIRSAWNGLVIEPCVSNAIKVRINNS